MYTSGYRRNIGTALASCPVSSSKPLAGVQRRYPVSVRAEPQRDAGIRVESPDAQNSNEQPPPPSTETSPPTTSATSALDASDKPEGEGSGGLDAKVLAPIAVVVGLAVIGVAAYLFKDQITDFMDFFTHAVDKWGIWGYLAYMAVYTALEILAVPAIPLTMTAGPIFGVVRGTAAVSVSSVLAATLAFLIARYAARERVEQLAKKDARFSAIDKAVGRNGLQVVFLLRLSPLLPLALSNYLYGLTSVELGPYVLGSWLGMLPGTLAYVSAGYYGYAIVEGSEKAGVAGWQVALGAAVTAGALWYIARLAKKALDEVDQADGDSKQQKIVQE